MVSMLFEMVWQAVDYVAELILNEKTDTNLLNIWDLSYQLCPEVEPSTPEQRYPLALCTPAADAILGCVRR